MSRKPDLMEWLTLVLGPCVFALIVLVGVAGVIWDLDDLKLGDLLAATAAGAGLLAVSHGFHRSARIHRETARRNGT